MSIITVENVSKKFRIPHEKKTTLFQHIIGAVKGQFDYEEFWALKDVSFEVRQGEAFGIIGPNGSGKSTLLSLLARVIYPDTGSVTVDGKVAPFLALGVGFQPELTARENVYIYSSILGVGRRQVDVMYDDIFDFAELRRFENMKLKNLSSGMTMRLAFSVAVHADPDAMLIDEAFAVGDAAFQKKCHAKIRQFRAEERTIVFVSHNLGQVRELCPRSMLLSEGHVATIGDTVEVIGEYQRMLGEDETR